MAVGFGLGAVAVQGLHAQAKPPVYYIGEIDVTNADAYTKEYQPVAAIRASRAATGSSGNPLRCSPKSPVAALAPEAGANAHT